MDNRIMNMDPVNHPLHYQSSNGVECIDAITAATENLSGTEAYLAGNAIKYIWRYRKKGKPVEDLQKAIWYINRLIDLIIDKGGENFK